LDRVSVIVRLADRFECGTWAAGRTLDWHVYGIVARDALVLPTQTGTESTSSIVCRAADESGLMLSADSIRWRFVDGAIRVLPFPTEIFGPGPGPGGGAHVYYAADTAGSVIVRATLGAVSRDLAITIE